MIDVDPSSIAGDSGQRVVDILSRSKPHVPGLASSSCAGWIRRVISYAVQGNYNGNHICHGASAWASLACFLSKHPDRVIYAGPPITTEEALPELRPGDIMYFRTPNTWPKWSGFNVQHRAESRAYCKSIGRTGGSCVTARDGAQAFCEKGSYDNLDDPIFCTFDESGISHENFPIVSHIAIYMGDGLMGDQMGSKQSYDVSLKRRERYEKGIKAIIRPEYPITGGALVS